MKNSEVIEKAADIIEERGWCTLSPENARGHVCADGALALAFGLPQADDCYTPNGGFIELADSVADALNLPWVSLNGGQLGNSIVRIWHWNDSMVSKNNLSDDEAKQRVLDGLRKAAKIVRREEENDNS